MTGVDPRYEIHFGLQPIQGPAPNGMYFIFHRSGVRLAVPNGANWQAWMLTPSDWQTTPWPGFAKGALPWVFWNPPADQA